MHLIKVLKVGKVSRTLFFSPVSKKSAIEEENCSVTYSLSTCKTNFNFLSLSLAHVKIMKIPKVIGFFQFSNHLCILAFQYDFSHCSVPFPTPTSYYSLLA